ncbi:MAG TPA: HlyD family efflux transporter periplasmic adaptor subunit, partial [Candidatus Limnocylindrales bacterium]|nr:HlyD family efflux transporter periplasmic adaptor subunit [Candidatus Limnocylindrales bacterium]
LMRDGDWVQRGSIIARISLPEQLSQENIPEQSGQEQAGDESIVVTPEEITAVIVEVRAPATGTITSIMAHNEAVVSEGQALAEIQDLDRSAQIEQQIPLRKIQIRQAQLDLADLQTRQKKNRDGSVIHAPISGTVIIPEPASAFSVGMDIPQGTVLASIVDYTELEVIVPVDELDINKVREGQTVIVTVEALPGQIIVGEVTMISSRGKIMGGVTTFDVTVAIAPVEGLKIGMNARADILVDQRIDTLLVPIEAVFEQEGESMVMVASGEQGAGNRPVKVVTGGHDTFFIEILSGVSEGQQIVIQGAPTDLVRPGGTNGNFGPFQGSDE